MRTPREDILPRSERLRILALDVTRPESIAAAIEACGPIDVLVNNARIGVIGVFEATPVAGRPLASPPDEHCGRRREEREDEETGHELAVVKS